MVLTETPKLSKDKNCPDFKLKAVDGNTYFRDDFLNKPLIVCFICNHCPYVMKIEDKIIKLNIEAKKLGANLIGICSNDSNNYPEDSFDELKKRWTSKKYNFPYLHDLDQNVAKAFDAVCTPDFFVYDKNHKLKYRGRIDDLLNALKKIIDNKPINFDQLPSIGCSIKWI